VGGGAIERRQTNSSLPRPTPVDMATKFDTKSTITRHVYEISLRSFRLTGGFGGQDME